MATSSDSVTGPVGTKPVAPNPVGGNPVVPTSPAGFSPNQIRAAYGLPLIQNGTLPAGWTGAGQTIAIVVAYNDPYLPSAIQQFDSEYGLPAPPSLDVLDQGGAATPLPSATGSAVGTWNQEELLDVEWAHAIAPGASIDVIEANGAGTGDLFAAVATAAELPGVSVVSMSWTTGESALETSADALFTSPAGHQGVAFVAAAGDSGGAASYPASSPNVLSVGGTTLSLNPAGGSYAGETEWSGTNGGPSAYEPMPSYQAADGLAGDARQAPDVAFDANPSTGVAVYDATAQGGVWVEMGGTSLGTRPGPGWSPLPTACGSPPVARRSSRPSSCPRSTTAPGPTSTRSARPVSTRGRGSAHHPPTCWSPTSRASARPVAQHPARVARPRARIGGHGDGHLDRADGGFLGRRGGPSDRLDRSAVGSRAGASDKPCHQEINERRRQAASVITRGFADARDDHHDGEAGAVEPAFGRREQGAGARMTDFLRPWTGRTTATGLRRRPPDRFGKGIELPPRRRRHQPGLSG